MPADPTGSSALVGAEAAVAHYGMRQPLIVGAAQPSSLPHDVRGNAERHAAAVRSADARLVVFPELSLTGYELDAEAVSTADPRLNPIVDACRTAGSVALVGAPIEDDSGRLYIATLLVDGTEVRVAYRKIWLGAAEGGRFTAGPAPVVVELGGWRIGLAICKDTGVPDHASATAALGFDLYVAAVLESHEDADVQAARARRVATDHGAWVVVASFAGRAGGGYDRGAGCSGIWRPDGSVAAQVGPDVGELARAVIC